MDTSIVWWVGHFENLRLNNYICVSSSPFILYFIEAARCIAGRFTPDTFTNLITKQFREPRLLVVTDPHTDAQSFRESSYVNLAVIALYNFDSPLQDVQENCFA